MRRGCRIVGEQESPSTAPLNSAMGQAIQAIKDGMVHRPSRHLVSDDHIAFHEVEALLLLGIILRS